MITDIHESWKPLFFNGIPQSFFLEIDNMNEEDYFPVKEDIFRVFQMPLEEIKVVILGQDPYIKVNQSVGLAFAVPSRIMKPPSLKIIETELGKNIDRTMKPWIEQGVFLLNTALTVERGESGSHIQLWQDFTGKIIKFISENNPCIWMLWGKHAQSYIQYISNLVYEYPKVEELEMNVVLVSPHPAAECYATNAGFYGCNHFSLANNALQLKNKSLINW